MRRFSAISPYLLLALLTAVVFYKLAFTNMILARGDAYSYFYPYWDARNAAFQQGQLPLWTPDIFMGAPLLANPQLGTFYPLNWLMTWLPAPDGIRYSVLLHTLWAAVGMYILFSAVTRAWYVMPLRKYIHIPGLCAAVIYAFGGAFTAHVEQINQLQGLSWLPWLFYFWHRILTPQPPLHFRPHPLPSFPNMESGSEIPLPMEWGRVIDVLLLTACFALQIFSGHTQTVFISGAGLALYALIFGLLKSNNTPQTRWNRIFRIVLSLGLLGIIAISAVILALPQILPTLELTGMSYRGGSGFTAQQATAFSLPLSYIGRSLLPSYDGQLFTEYMATPGVVGLALALVAITSIFLTQRHRDTEFKAFRQNVITWLFIAFIGLFFAFGRYNPIYLLLAELPGFDLFRVPARWLALFGIGVAMLAGLGVQWLIDEKHHVEAQRQTSSPNPLSKHGEREPDSPNEIGRGWRTALIMAIPLILLMVLTRFIFSVAPEDVMGAAVPTNTTLLLWGVALMGIILIWVLKNSRFLGVLLFSLMTLELFGASQIMPFNDLVPREVYTGQRFTISQMQALTEDEMPPGRMLSISSLLFDVGDKSVLEERFRRYGMDNRAIHTAFTAVKKQEMVFHNLPLTWGIQSVDGMDGGVLPTIYYSQFTSLLLPENTLRTTDGRLGEMLALPECRGACIPDNKYLRMMDVQYLLTDKVYDVWHEGVAYDTAWRFVSTTERATALNTPNNVLFTATQLNILYTNNDNSSAPPVITIQQDEKLESIPSDSSPVDLGDFWLAVYRFGKPLDLNELRVSSAVSLTQFYAATLIDDRTGDFVSLTPLNIERVLSSDIKVDDVDVPYHLSDEQFMMQRARIINGVIPLPDTWQGSEDALNIIQQHEFLPEIQAVIHGSVEAKTGDFAGIIPEIITYTANRVEMRAENVPSSSYLVLSDAWYPGWKAIVNGETMPVYRANVMFRAVPVPAGESKIIFYFEPDLWYLGMAVGAIAWLMWGIVMLWQLRKINHRS